ncbi:MAG: hypothetical protein AAF393_02675 [Pseudomonadota bacterium]
MSEEPKQRKGLRILAVFVAVVGALILGPDLFRKTGPSGGKAPPKMECYAAAVALHQHLFDASQQTPPVVPDYQDEFEAVFKEMIEYTRGLRRRDDPKAHGLRPVIARAETARDAAVAEDAEKYRADAWKKVRTCHLGEFSREVTE